MHGSAASPQRLALAARARAGECGRPPQSQPLGCRHWTQTRRLIPTATPTAHAPWRFPVDGSRKCQPRITAGRYQSAGVGRLACRCRSIPRKQATARRDRPSHPRTSRTTPSFDRRGRCLSAERLFLSLLLCDPKTHNGDWSSDVPGYMSGHSGPVCGLGVVVRPVTRRMG